jgi:hypothetical protein
LWSTVKYQDILKSTSNTYSGLLVETDGARYQGLEISGNFKVQKFVLMSCGEPGRAYQVPECAPGNSIHVNELAEGTRGEPISILGDLASGPIVPGYRVWVDSILKSYYGVSLSGC